MLSAPRVITFPIGPGPRAAACDKKEAEDSHSVEVTSIEALARFASAVTDTTTAGSRPKRELLWLL